MTAKIKTVVESFELDHDKVLAPYVRLIDVQHPKDGSEGTVSNFDIRLTQPNVTNIDTSSLHTIEHAMAGLVRDRIPGLIDASPFGCQTGFHAIFWGTPSVEEVVKAYTSAFESFLEFDLQDVPGVARKQCGAFKMHSLQGAKEWVKIILEQGFSTDPFERKLIGSA